MTEEDTVEDEVSVERRVSGLGGITLDVLYVVFIL